MLKTGKKVTKSPLMGSNVKYTNYVKHEGDRGWIKINEAYTYNKDRQMTVVLCQCG
jgi:hypothetical protein